MRKALTLVGVLVVLLAAPPAADAEPTVLGGIECAPQSGVRLCEGTVAGRVPTFDGAGLLDVNVTLPETGSGPFPLLVLGHGWGGQKGGLADSGPWAVRGYAVLYASARGFGASCGTLASRQAAPAACTNGHIRLGDTRYEARDAQDLVGRLVDEGIADPQRVGAAGCSYGGALALGLALLRDRVMLPSGAYAPWLSPAGTPIRLAAAAPCATWSDLPAALVPNGRDLDYAVPAPRQSREPVGVPKQALLQGLLAAANQGGFLSAPGSDPAADLTTWVGQLGAGEPFAAGVPSFSAELSARHSALGVARAGPPAPLLLQAGWVDDLFPARELLQLYTVLRSELGANAKLALFLADYGHPRSQNKYTESSAAFFDQVAWFDYYVRGVGAEPPGGVRAYTLRCPATAPSQGPFTAATWAALHPGEIRGFYAYPAAFGNPATQGSGDVLEDLLIWIGSLLNPGAGTGTASPATACGSVTSADRANTATYRLAAAGASGFTVLGSPTVVSVLGVSGASAQVAARLWDVAPGGTQTLVSRGSYRPGVGGLHVFQLNPVGYRFEPGHVAKLELLGGDAAYGRLSNGSFLVQPYFTELRLPVAEAPGEANGRAAVPAPPVLPAGRTLAP
jgi:dienelactone hydrolase